MNSLISSISQFIFLGSIAVILFLLRNYLFRKYESINYFFLVIVISTFSVGCFYLGKSSEQFFSKVELCPYVQETFWCFLGNYLSILPQLIVIIIGLIFLFGVIESLDVQKNHEDE